MKKNNVIIAKMKMVESGIAPAMTGDQLTKMLDSMTENDKRTAKRKFRKLWRKEVKNDSSLCELLGFGENNTTKAQLRHRSSIIAIKFVKLVS